MFCVVNHTTQSLTGQKKNNGDNGKHCLKPLDPLKNLEGLPLTNTSKLIDVTQPMIHWVTSWLKPTLIRISRKKDQSALP